LSKIAQDHFVGRADYAVSKLVDGEVVLLNLNNGAYFSLNVAGATVWKLCSGKKKIRDIVLAVSRKFPRNKNRINKDVLEFLGELKRQRLVKMTPAPISTAKRGLGQKRNFA